MEECWKQAPGFDRYEVSNLGRIRHKQRRNIRLAKAVGAGYPMITFRDKGRPVSVRVHRLVALAFVPRTEESATVNHIDGDKSNNRADNLEWVSQKANNAHAVDTGLLVKARGEQINTARLTEAQVRIIKACLRSGTRQIDLAREHGVDACTIGDIAAGRSWKHV